MSPQRLKKFISKFRKSNSASPHVSPPPTPISQSSSPLQTPISTANNLKERLWNEAYDNLKRSESKLVETYENFLSAELPGDSHTPAASAENHIKPDPQERWHQMELLVQVGLQKTKKEAEFKQKASDVIRVISPLKEVIGKAVQAAPEAAIAWVGASFALEILANPVTESGINRDGITYVVSKMEWYWNLVDLLFKPKDASPDFKRLRLELERHIIELYQKLLLYQMKSVCLYYMGRGAAFVRDMFKLDNWAGRLDDIKAVEANVQRCLKQYNSQETLQSLQSLEDAANSQVKELQLHLKVLEGIAFAIKDQTRQEEEIQRKREYKKCLVDLRVTDPRDDKRRIQEAKGGLLTDSYIWVLRNSDFCQWRDNQDQRLLWVKGDPGKGKTMLLCGIIDELEKTHAQGELLSYFFCQATNNQLNTATAVLRGLIFMLLDQDPSLISYMRNKYDQAGKALFQDVNAWQAMSEIFTNILHDSKLQGICLLVDALDECSVGLDQLLCLITETSKSTGVKWLVSSRNWEQIEEKLRAIAQRLSLEVNASSVSTAVDSYITFKVSHLSQLKGYRDNTASEVRQYLSSNADGTFLWVALTCQELEKTPRRRALEKMKSFPPGLDAFYERMMQQINGKEDAELCRQILALMATTYRPLLLAESVTLIEECRDLADDLESLQDIISLCGSFLTIRQDTIYFVHQSAKDFLLNKAYAAFDQILPCGIARQHHVIFSRSLEVLSRTLRRDIYKLRNPGSSIEDISPPNPDPLASLKYSSTHWVDHLEHSNPTDSLTCVDLQDNNSVHTFLKCHYIH